MRSKINLFLVSSLILGLVFISSCKRSGVDYPGPTGPSTLAVLLNLSAAPNVIYAGTARETTTVTANLVNFTGDPIANKLITFEVRDSSGFRIYAGFFDGKHSVVTKSTNSGGSVIVTYHGPTTDELADVTGNEDSQVYIYAFVRWEGKDLISEQTPIYIVNDVMDVSFEVEADPNVLWCASVKPRSVITGIFKKTDGVPIVGRRVFFKILSGRGEFPGGLTKTYAVTNAEGIATIRYIGPKGSEMAAPEEFVTIQGHAETWWSDSPNNFWLHQEIEIRLIKGN